MCRWSRSAPRFWPSRSSMSRSASSSRTGFVRPAPDRRGPAIGLKLRDALYRRRSFFPMPEPFRFCERKFEETYMAVDGNWNIVMSTPMGERKTTLTLKNAGGTLTGSQAADGDSTEIFEGTANGDDVA